MLEDSIQKWNPWWSEKEAPKELVGTNRTETQKIEKTLNLKHIKDIIGVRRSGKTTIMYQIIQILLKKTTPKNIVFLNFDDPDINKSEFSELIKTIEKINPNTEYLFLDEIQQKKNWEQWLRTLYDTKKFKQIIISGSSASLISQDIGRTLTGRHLTFTVFPFSFKEYLKYIGWKNFNRDHLQHNKNKLLHHINNYVKNGGFPETINKSNFEREVILTNIYNDILSRDIASRFNASFDIAKKISYFLLSNNSKEFSLRTISKGAGVDVETAKRYLEFFKDVFMILTLNAFSYKLKVQHQKNKKAYAIDTGLRNSVSFNLSEDLGRLYENIVFIELKRRNQDVYYWKNNYEIDFIIKKGLKISELIQVCHTPENDTKKRETKALLKGMEFFKLKNSIVITEDYEAREKIQNKTIKFIPLWKWLLHSNLKPIIF